MTHTLSRTPLDEGSAHRKDLYPTTHNTHERQKTMPEAGFESAISASLRPQTHFLNCASVCLSYGESTFLWKIHCHCSLEMCMCVCMYVWRAPRRNFHLDRFRSFLQPPALYANSILCYLAVTHLSTNHAQFGLIAVK